MVLTLFCYTDTADGTVMLTVVHVAMVHIVVHALPEAALFVIVGSVLHTVGSQDGRTMASASQQCHS